MENFQEKFIEEAQEFIQGLEESLLILEQNPNEINIINEIFRIMHSLKGSGAMFGFENISEFTHNLETIYDKVRKAEMPVNKELFDITLASVDHLKNLLNKIQTPSVLKNHQHLISKITQLIDNNRLQVSPQIISTEEQETIKTSPIQHENIKSFFICFEPKEYIFDNGTNPLYLIDELAVMGRFKSFPRFKKIPSLEKIITTKCYTFWDMILSTEEDINAIKDVFIFIEDDCELEIIELSSYNIFTIPEIVGKIESENFINEEINANEFKKLIDEFNPQKQITESDSITNIDQKINEIQTEIEKETEKISQQSESAFATIRVSSAKLDQMMNLVSELVTAQARLMLLSDQSQDNELITIAENIEKLSRQLRENAFDICLIPIKNILTRFKRLTRDLSAELQKDIDFKTIGIDTELDKNIIESLTDPIMHLLRNAIDHGIEDSETREKLGKPKKGTITFKAYYSGTNVHIAISDDGSGLDIEKITQKAISLGYLSADEKRDKKELLDFIFLPGFTTSGKITDVSGRGVGLDVVKRKINNIRGEIDIESEINVGTTFTIIIPLTLSIIDGLLVSINNNKYIIPLSVVNKIFEAHRNQIEASYNNVIVLDGEQIPFLNLRNEFDMENSCPETLHIVVVNYNDVKLGLAVDNVISENQAVLKPLGKYLKHNDIFSGASILGDGNVALVMDTNKIINRFTNT